jgi:hypothetical protein
MSTLKNTTINDTGFIQIPAGTTAQRVGTTNGMIRVNTNTTPYVLEIYQGGWRTLKILN